MHWYVMIFEFSVFFMFYPQENKKRRDGPLGSLLDEDWSGSLLEEDWGGSVWNHRPLPSTLRWWSKSTLFAPVPPLTHSSTDKLILGSKIKKSQGGLGRNLEKTPHHILNSESHYDHIPVWYCPSLRGRRRQRFSIEFSPEFSPILAKIWVNCKKMRKFGWRKWHQLWREFSWKCTWRKCHPIWRKFLWILKWGENLSDESVTKFGNGNCGKI